MKTYYLYILLIIKVIIIISCNYRHSKTGKNTNDNILTKKITFPNSLLKLDGRNLKKVESFKTNIENKNKIK